MNPGNEVISEVISKYDSFFVHASTFHLKILKYYIKDTLYTHKYVRYPSARLQVLLKN